MGLKSSSFFKVIYYSLFLMQHTHFLTVYVHTCLLTEIMLEHFPSAGACTWALMEQTDTRANVLRSQLRSAHNLNLHSEISVGELTLKLLSLFTCVIKMVESRTSDA